ncbi:MAG: biotin transporter BioY [Planctomycetes bacterium]|nr:biotin transporter BioY [Planctomycetota bacterium]
MTASSHRALLGWRPLLLAVVGATAFALAAQLRVPMHPVPMTLQTAAICAFALLVRWPAALLATVGYLLAAWAGLPVLSGGASFAATGLFDAKTAGYVIGFVPAALLLAVAAPRSVTGAFAGAMLAHAVVLLVGWAWLAGQAGVAAAWQHGVEPFLVAAVAKSALAAPVVLLRRDAGARPR